ncbi:hypothetical protein HPP92_021391 [Vanilla planifolia]|uniref:Uncharacterized protein n=1 Tax=Vanilla planifolia TaxID=51239 RepID=A0A835Q298_VANPL|nr:hypothetical protein HPP92_021391 [Vanilla planifolia]
MILLAIGFRGNPRAREHECPKQGPKKGRSEIDYDTMVYASQFLRHFVEKD